jgi:hypothetical protein
LGQTLEIPFLLLVFPLVLENSSIYLFWVAPASCALALAAPVWAVGCWCLFPCGLLASAVVRALPFGQSFGFSLAWFVCHGYELLIVHFV